MMGRKIEYILVYPENHQHLGLFRDLEDLEYVHLFVAGHKNIKSPILKKIRRYHLSRTINKYIPLPYRSVWYKRILINIDGAKEYCIMIVDGALKFFSVNYLNRLFELNHVRGVLVMINAMDAGSIAVQDIRKKIKKVNWEDVYSFDPGDVEKYGFLPLGQCYYSMHDTNEIIKGWPEDVKRESDMYFVGALKGGRENLIISVYRHMLDCGVKLNFNVMVSGERRLYPLLYHGQINYYSGGWFPYDKVLAGVLGTNVIVEILQEGQKGPSLRYYEAVCYNKKLLTSNHEVINFPYYDERYMRIFDKAEDIDIGWIKKKEDVNYHYNGDFSPCRLLDAVLR